MARVMQTGAVTPYPTVTGAESAHGSQTTAGDNPWLPYFGPAAGPLVTNAYDKYAEQNYDLPEAYKGKNLFLRDTINGLITGEGRNDFYTAALLPWQQTDQITFSWNEFHFNETLAGRVPHEGVSRLVTSSKRTKMDKAVRRGLAMILEHGFMSTGEGREMYRRNLIGISQSVQETANHDVMAAIFTCDNYDQRWERDHGIVTDGLRRLMNEEVYRYACVQKEPNGLDVLVEDAKKRMGRYGVSPDSLVIPPKLSIYMSLVRPEKSQYYLGGPIATSNVQRGAAMTDFRGLSVYETRSFDVYKGEPPVDISLRRRQVGEYYTVPANHDVIIYDEGADNWRRIPFSVIASNANRHWHENAGEGNMPTPQQQRGYAHLAEQLSKNGWQYYLPDDSGGGNWFTGPPSVAAMFSDGFRWHHPTIEVPPDPQWSGDGGVEGPSGTNKQTWVCVNRAGGVKEGLSSLEWVASLANKATAMVSHSLQGDSSFDIRTKTAELFGLDSQSAEFQRAFAGSEAVGSGSDSTRGIVANAAGYTGHPALHQSYTGLQMISVHGTPQQISKARAILSIIDTAYRECNLHEGFSSVAATMLPSNYLHTSDGLRFANVSSERAAKNWLFSTLASCQFGHTLVPVGTDGRIDAVHANLSGDTIVCPGFAVSRFASARSGVCSGLALTNVGIGVVGTRAPGSVPGVNDHRWNLGAASTAAVQASVYIDTHNHTKDSALLESDSSSLKSARRSAVATPAPKRRAQGSNPLMDMLSHDAERSSARRERDELTARQNSVDSYTETNVASKTSAGGAVIVTPSSVAASQGVCKALVDNLEAIRRQAPVAVRNSGAFTAAALGLLAQPIGGSTFDGSRAELERKLGGNPTGYANANDAATTPFAYILFRPFIEHQMHTIVCMKAGAETGATFYGHNSVTVGDDAVSKMHYVNLTFYSKAVVKETKNIIRLEDVYASGYIGGNNCRFFQDVGEVKSYDAARPDASSLFCSLALSAEVSQMQNPISITGKFNPALDKDGAAAYMDSRRTGSHFSGAAYMSGYWSLDKVVQNDPKQHSVSPEFITQSRPVNSVCFQGAQFTTKVKMEAGGAGDAGEMEFFIPNSGHWGPTYPGVRAVRDGQHKYMKDVSSGGVPQHKVHAGVLS